jgi:hypothetical protein
MLSDPGHRVVAAFAAHGAGSLELVAVPGAEMGRAAGNDADPSIHLVRFPLMESYAGGVAHLNPSGPPPRVMPSRRP